MHGHWTDLLLNKVRGSFLNFKKFPPSENKYFYISCSKCGPPFRLIMLPRLYGQIFLPSFLLARAGGPSHWLAEWANYTPTYLINVQKLSTQH
jgi:hypothetical protein